MNRALLVVGFIAFSTSLFIRAIDPVVPQISGEFGIPAADVALLATAFALPFAIIQPLLGPIGDFFGKTKLMRLWVVRSGGKWLQCQLPDLGSKCVDMFARPPSNLPFPAVQ